jgi:hypothetical protein
MNHRRLFKFDTDMKTNPKCIKPEGLLHEPKAFEPKGVYFLFEPKDPNSNTRCANLTHTYFLNVHLSCCIA